MNTLLIRHNSDTSFHVVRARDNKSISKPIKLAPPHGFPVEGRPDSDLTKELRWYLEDFLGYPFHPETEHAERVLASLDKWGRDTFNALFDNREGGGFLSQAAPNGQYQNLRLQISSDDPSVLAWPWEALADGAAGRLAQLCQIERRLNAVLDPPPIDERLPQDLVNVLLVTARPFEADVDYRSISRPLVELIDKHQLPAHVTVLRPPTFDQLSNHLRENPHHYHILHFDGHGGYGSTAPDASGSHMYDSPSVGRLVFEDEHGKPHRILAQTLGELLREHAVPAVVLNACQSAMVDDQAEDQFASVAASLLRSGTRSVVAMAYSLYVSGAQEFLPDFYKRFFTSGDTVEAVRAGRQRMHAKPDRICARGTFPLQDWLVPVVYQQDPLDFKFAADAAKTAQPRKSNLPEDAQDDKNPYGFIGRDGPVLELERAMLRPPAAILITGLGGIGKTTLARGFVEWLEQTEGLGAGCLWFNFADIRSAEFVINRIGESVLGGDFSVLKMDQKLDALVGALREKRVVIVWDNFEVARGIEGTSITANLTEEDRQLLRRFLEKLRAGASKVIITSRAAEDWLGHENRFLLPIPGLSRAERWEYCQAVLDDLGMSPNRDDPAMVDLMDVLDGHPLAMRAILPRLADRSPSSLVEAVRTNLYELDLPENDVSKQLAAILKFIEESLPSDQRPLLIPLSLHAEFVDADNLQAMAEQVDKDLARTLIDRFCESLSGAGLLRDMGHSVFAMHPALTGYLRARIARTVSERTHDRWVRAFIDVMARVADILGPMEFHEQRTGFLVHGSNFRHALAEAQRLGMALDQMALLQSLAANAIHLHDLEYAERIYSLFAETARATKDRRLEAGAYHQLGVIAMTQRDFASAGRWYRKSLAIKEEQGNQRGAAITYHQLGRIAEEHRDFASAEQWYQKSLAVKEKLGNDHDAASTYHQLGFVAQARHDFASAERWYRKSLAICEKQGDELGAAKAYHQLGITAQIQNDLVAAERSYHKAVAITERLKIERHAAPTYHQLGIVAQEQHDFASAEQWYRKSIAIKEKLNDEHGAAITYGQLGIIAALQGRFEESGQWLIKSVAIFLSSNDEHNALRNSENFSMAYEGASPGVRRKLEVMWREAGLGDLPEISEDGVFQ